MDTVLMVILEIVMLVCLTYFCTFVKKEGKDERGQIILGKAGQLIYGSIFLCYAILMTINHYLNFSNQQFVVALTTLVVLIMIINCISISIFKNRI
ncbi:hypothetical protein HPT25_12995 [Bacillus sp. BRMEA1]|uniref:hypothetical protein n=1 Tax=Neobacillus endophyticus TaxID=2738405 RepID=UPI0015651BD8|nr:hypothetical protein [Neobacillus endophyticus]NRD78284.1 hypothetical protein [Neobacillus endophyticus]